MVFVGRPSLASQNRVSACIFVNNASILFHISTHCCPSAALEAKFKIAVKTLLKASNLTVQEAMLVAKFSTKDIKNKSMQKIIARRISGGKRAMAVVLPPASLPPSIVDVPQCHSPQILNLTTLSGATEIAGHIQPPKRKQQKMTHQPCSKNE